MMKSVLLAAAVAVLGTAAVADDFDNTAVTLENNGRGKNWNISPA